MKPHIQAMLGLSNPTAARSLQPVSIATGKRPGRYLSVICIGPPKAIQPNPVEQEWARALPLARSGCGVCRGTGRRVESVCQCVLRSIFRACFEKYHNLQVMTGAIGAPSYDRQKSTGLKRMWGIKRNEFIADFEIIARRALSADEHKLFTMYFLQNLKWEQCAGPLGVDRGNFFHGVYRIEAKVGRAFFETKPYGIYPIDEYMSNSRVEEPKGAKIIPFPKPAVADSFPLAPAAMAA